MKRKLFTQILMLFLLFSNNLAMAQTSQKGGNQNLKMMNEEELEDYIINHFNYSKILLDLNIDTKYRNEKNINFRKFVYNHIQLFYHSIHDGIASHQSFKNKDVEKLYNTFLDSTITLVQVDKNEDENNGNSSPIVKAGGICNNVDFEDGNLSGWTLRNGKVDGSTTYSFVDNGAGTAGANFLITTTGVDPICGIPMKDPNGGNSSCRLGDGTGTGSNAARMSNTFMVTSANAIFSFSYAVVLQDPGHSAQEQPYFSFKVLDQLGNSINCGTYSAIASGSIPGFQTSGNVRYKDWSTVLTDLTAYIGQSITVEFTTGDCSQGGHYGYAYIDAYCGNPEIIVSDTTGIICDGEKLTLSAVLGGNSGLSFLWNTGETTPSINVDSGGVYSVIMTPQSGTACSVSLQKNITITTLTTTANFGFTSSCLGSPTLFYDSSFVTPTNLDSIFHWSWNFGDIATASGQNPSHTYATNGTYNVKLIVYTTQGCNDTVTKTITINPLPTAIIVGDITVCQNDPTPQVLFTGSNGLAPYTFTYTDPSGISQTITTSNGNTASLPVPTNISGSYTYTLTEVKDGNTPICPNPQNDSVTVNVISLPTATISGSTTLCQNATQPQITFTGSNGITPYTFTYTLNGGAQQTISTSASSSTVVINLPTSTPGTYSYDLVSVVDNNPARLCTNPQTGNASITIHPLPIINLGADTTTCSGSPVQLLASGTAVSYSWNLGVPSNGANVTPPVGSTTYTVTATTAFGCIGYDSLTVNVNPLPAAVITDNAVVCLNDVQPIITFTGSIGAAPYIFRYKINNGNTLQITSNNAGVATLNAPTNTDGIFNYSLISVQDASSTQCLSNTAGLATIKVNKLPMATISGSDSVCQYSPSPQIVFTGSNTSAPYTFTYTVNGGPQQVVTTPANSNSAIVWVPTSATGTYTYSLVSVKDGQTTHCSQSQSGTAIIVVNEQPNANTSGTIQVCKNDNQPSITYVGVGGSAPYTFTYNINGGSNQTVTSIGNTATIPVPTSISGSYTYSLVSVLDGSTTSCTRIINQNNNVVVWPLPSVDAGNDIVLCQGADTVLKASGAVTYQWNNNVQDGMPFIPQDTLYYTVIGTDSNGCKNIDSVKVSVVPTPQINLTTSAGSGCSPLKATLNSQITGNIGSCTWTLSNGMQFQNCGPIQLTLTEPGCYDVTLTTTSPEGCSNTVTGTSFLCVYANPIAEFELTPTEMLSSNTMVNFFNHSVNAAHYHWNFGDETSSNEVDPVHVFPEMTAGNYTVTLIATSEDGMCKDSTMHTVKIIEDLIYYIPNSFTPDGDEYNNTFKPVFTQGFDKNNYNLQIFNRWGEMVFESRDPNYGWDGVYRGKVCQDGTYVWKINIKKLHTDERVELVGHLNLLK